MPSSPAAARKISEALHRLQTAQDNVGRALEELSSLLNIGETYNHGHELYNQVKAYWYLVDMLRRSPENITTDKEPDPLCGEAGGLAMNSPWTHAICVACWDKERPERKPVVAFNNPPETCCWCGAETGAGIYVRHDPKALRCQGKDALAKAGVKP